MPDAAAAPPLDDAELARRVALAPDAEANGLANMLAGLLRHNLQDHPEKERDLARLVGRVAIVATDADVSLTLRFEGGRVTIHDGIFGLPDVTIRASGDDIMQMSLVELDPRFRLPDPRREGARAMFAASRDGRVEMHGSLGNVPLLLRLTRLMTVY